MVHFFGILEWFRVDVVTQFSRMWQVGVSNWQTIAVVNCQKMVRGWLVDLSNVNVLCLRGVNQVLWCYCECVGTC